MIKFKEEINLIDFKAWSGGKDSLNMIIEQGLLDDVTDYLNDVLDDEIPTKTEINDMLWFDDYINDLIIY